MPVPLECKELPRMSEAMRPYLNPAYWDGHRLGVSRANANLSAEADVGMVDFAVDELELVLTSTARGGTLENYFEGTIFEPDNYLPGTVVLLERETLAIDISDKEVPAGEKPRYVDMASFIGERLLPHPPTPVERQLSERQTAERPALSFEPYILFGGGLVYVNLALWGIVVLDDDKQNRLVTMPSGVIVERFSRNLQDIKEGSPGKIAIESSMNLRIEPSPVKIGSVQASNGKKLSNKRLHRTNNLYVVAEAV